MLQPRPFLVYKSSAGSGKTFTLSKVFLSIALRSQDPLYFKKILAITFTVKAANEMKERIVNYLSSISGNHNSTRKDASFMKAALMEELGLSNEEIENKCGIILHSILHNYGDLSVLTIDKFITRLVKLFASELSLSPDFEIEIDQSLFLDQIIDLLYDKIGEDKELTDLVLKFLRFRLNDEKSGKLDDAIKRTAFSLLSEEFFYIQENFREYTPKEIFKLKDQLDEDTAKIEGSIKIMSQKALDLIAVSGVEEKDLYYGKSGILSFFKKTASGDMSAILDPGIRAIKTLEEEKWHSKTNHPAIQSISTELGQIAKNLLNQKDEAQKFFLITAARNELFRLGFIGELSRLIEEFKESENIRLLSDFNRMISDKFLGEQAPFIYERLGNQFDNILIDEFQDTSNLQWQNLIPLVENSLAEAKTNLIVGDAKQSIYRFRGSEPQQFTNLPEVNHPAQELFKSSYEEFVLNSNFRSASNIVEFNNRFFSQFSTNILSSDFQNTYTNLKQQHISKELGTVRWWFTSTESKAKKEDALQLMINRALDLVSKENLSSGDICCLFRANNDAATFASAMLKHDLGVISEESLLLKNNPAVALLISTLSASRYSKDPFHLQKWLSKFHHVKRIDEYHKLAQQLKKEKWNFKDLMNAVGLNFDPQLLLQGEMFSKTFRLVDLFELDISDPFVLKFMDFCTEYESSAAYLKTSFLDFWDKWSDSLSIQLPEDKNAIRVMSIHKSKGLEFPVVMVFLPELAKGRNTNDESWVSLKEELGIEQMPLKTSALKNTQFEHILNLEEEKSSLDFINLLYVAFTRAETKLEIFSNPPSSKNDSTDFIKSWDQWNEEENCLKFS